MPIYCGVGWILPAANKNKEGHYIRAVFVSLDYSESVNSFSDDVKAELDVQLDDILFGVCGLCRYF